MENAALQMLSALLTAAAFVGVRRGFSMAITGKEWVPILWLGAVNTGIICWLYFSGIGKLPVQTVAVCGYLEPLFAVVLSVVFLHEALRPLQAAGAALIIGGAVFGERKHKRSEQVNFKRVDTNFK